jgi:hypothetical protein
VCLPYLKSAFHVRNPTRLTSSIEDIEYRDLEPEFELHEAQEKLLRQDEQIQRYFSRLEDHHEDDLNGVLPPDPGAEFEFTLSQESLQEQQNQISKLKRAVAAQIGKTEIEKILTRQKQSKLDVKDTERVLKELKFEVFGKQTREVIVDESASKPISTTPLMSPQAITPAT